METCFDPTGKNKRRVILHIGDYYADKDPIVLQTLLGSCVSVCLYDPQSRIGGMNHILMPGTADLQKFNTSARYGIHAMEVLINEIMKLGGNRQRLSAKVFGGSHTLSAIPEGEGIGQKNIDFVLKFLKAEKIQVVSKDVGGFRSRRIFYHLDTGDVYLKRGNVIDQNGLLKAERRQAAEQKNAQLFGDVTLFQMPSKLKKPR